MNDESPIHYAQVTFHNLLRALPELRPKKLKEPVAHQISACSNPGEHAIHGGGCKWERASDQRKRAYTLLRTRWSSDGEPFSEVSLRCFFMPFDAPSYRRPTKYRHGGFFIDLRKFGGARFAKNGDVVASSLNKGPTPDEFLESAPGGKTPAEAARARGKRARRAA